MPSRRTTKPLGKPKAQEIPTASIRTIEFHDSKQKTVQQPPAPSEKKESGPAMFTPPHPTLVFVSGLEPRWIGPEPKPPTTDQAKQRVAELSGAPVPTSGSIQVPEAETDERAMPPDSIVFKDGTLFKGGRPYRPLPLAAKLGQAPRQTLRNWIKNKTEFQGRTLQTYYLEALDRYFVSEESIDRMANRFIKWRSGEPAGVVTIGKTKDQSGFLSTSETARILGVSARTTWLWASDGKAPTDKPLDVIKCTTSNHFYIREKDVYELKKIVPRSGLQRGRRPQLAPRP